MFPLLKLLLTNYNNRLHSNSKNNRFADKIKCPKCGALIPITETLQHQLKESVRKEYEEKTAEERRSLSEQQEKIEQKENELKRKEKDIDERVEQSVKDELEKQKKIFAQDAKKQAEDDFELEIKDLKENLNSYIN